MACLLVCLSALRCACEAAGVADCDRRNDLGTSTQCCMGCVDDICNVLKPCRTNIAVSRSQVAELNTYSISGKSSR
eukprot:1160860-Pelagomonas_calceolata.AAC.4